MQAGDAEPTTGDQAPDRLLPVDRAEAWSVEDEAATDSEPTVEAGTPPPAGSEPASAGAASTEPHPASLRLDITTLDLGGDVVFVTDRDGTIQAVNDAFVRVTGYSRAEAIGATPKLLSSGFQDKAFYRNLWDTILRGEVWEGQLVDRRRDGLLRTHRATISPVIDEAGQIVAFVAVERDITGELGRQLATGSTGLLHTDLEGHCSYADGRAAALLDRPPSELLGRGFLASLIAEDTEEVREVIGMAVELGREHRLDVRTLRGRWLHLEAAPLSVASGTVIGATLTVEDVSDQVATHRELARRDAFVDSVLDALEDGVAVVGPDGCVLAVNRSWREAAEHADDALLRLRVGEDLVASARALAADSDDRARMLLEDLQLVLGGVGRGKRRNRTIRVSELGWEEGGAVLRLV
jgi:PAS domain S-box-containing protein